ncbi:putative photosystem II assembly factor TerC [Synechococcus sp. BIOS-E4-1]|uniref:TerC family protein n=1 Tax=Synechococcus sp. BIOS-E4-1 TaxID=1400864 RepID=UPI001645F826|nr:DUF475 domain-containing protein [Synechococcus sp. BIOS-E4-1]QNI54681.1 putative photosystem II assembly factor TerC [Synechococcus sp. BIOS-E4-1]
MDTAALSSLTAWLDGVDQLGELLPLLPVLITLEFILSADNAIALATIAREQRDPRLERRALNLGIVMAFGLRVGLILMAQYVLAFPPIQLIAGVYLLWLCFSHWNSSTDQISEKSQETSTNPIRFSRTVLTLAITDLAFSIDSVAAAVAISDQLLLVLTGALIGVVALRFTSGLFIRWLQIYPRLETAGFLAVGFVGLKLLVLTAMPTLHPSELLTLAAVIGLMIWGFSLRESPAAEES